MESRFKLQPLSYPGCLVWDKFLSLAELWFRRGYSHLIKKHVAGTQDAHGVHTVKEHVAGIQHAHSMRTITAVRVIHTTALWAAC